MRYGDKTIKQFTKIRTPRRLKKNLADELRKLVTVNIALHLLLAKKSELSFNHKDVFTQVCTDVF